VRIPTLSSSSLLLGAVPSYSKGDGAIAVLREGWAQEGAVDAGGGPEAARLH
jgi:hypothetical protein